MSQKTLPHPLVLGAGGLLSLFFLWLAVRDVSWNGLVGAFASLRLLPVLAAATALWLGIRLRAIRWRVIAGFAAPDQGKFVRATTLGVLSNMILPGRAGEVVRVLTLARACGSSIVRPLASALIDRLVDVVVLLLSAGLLMLWLPVSNVLMGWVKPILVIAGFGVACIVVYARGVGRAERFMKELLKRWLKRWPVRFEIFLSELREEFRRLLGGWLSFELVAVTVLVLAVDYFAISALLWSFDLRLPVAAPLLLWAFFSIGSALPSAPGYVGVYQVAAVWAFSIFSAPAAIAVALATVLQITTLLVAIAMAGPHVVVAVKQRVWPANRLD